MSAKKLREAAERLSREIELNGEDDCVFTQDVKLAAAACTTLAAQMESAEQGFEEWYMSDQTPDDGYSQQKAAWHAAQAAMQAKLDAANALLDAAARRVDVKVIESLQRELDAANERVKELEAWQKDAFKTLFEAGKLQGDTQAALATAERNVEMLCGEVRRMEALAITYYLDYLRRTGIYIPNKTPDELAIDLVYIGRSPEVRALVDAAGPSGATG